LGRVLMPHRWPSNITTGRVLPPVAASEPAKWLSSKTRRISFVAHWRRLTKRCSQPLAYRNDGNLKAKPHRSDWKAFETPGVELVFPKKDARRAQSRDLNSPICYKRPTRLTECRLRRPFLDSIQTGTPCAAILLFKNSARKSSREPARFRSAIDSKGRTIWIADAHVGTISASL
jgi:hypothetical protein